MRFMPVLTAMPCIFKEITFATTDIQCNYYENTAYIALNTWENSLWQLYFFSQRPKGMKFWWRCTTLIQIVNESLRAIYVTSESGITRISLNFCKKWMGTWNRKLFSEKFIVYIRHVKLKPTCGPHNEQKTVRRPHFGFFETFFLIADTF